MPIYRVTIFDGADPIIGPSDVSARDSELAVIDVIIHTSDILNFNTNDLFAVITELDNPRNIHMDVVADIIKRYHARPDNPIQ